MNNKFYVYEHWRPDRDVCFYVGKGHGRRANDMRSGRNRFHKFIQDKLSRLGMCVEVRLVAEALSEKEAFALEIERIAFWRANGNDLANLTDGGEGISNPSKETRQLMRDAKVGKRLSNEHKQKIGEGTKKALSNPIIKEKFLNAQKEVMSRESYRKKQSASQKARVRTKEHYAKISAALTGRKLSPEHAVKAKAASLGRKQSPEEIERRKISNTGKKRTSDFCQKMSLSWTEERKAAQRERTIAMNESRKTVKSTVHEVEI